MIVVIFTGGTISMRSDARGGGAVPALSGGDLIALTPGIETVAALEVDDWGAHPGPHMTIERMWDLRSRISRHVARPEVSGVVVTHGTDTLEETAYLVARSVASEKPIVFTGAMRTSTDHSWDGPANLMTAARAAASYRSRGHGVLVAFTDRLYSALEVTKIDAQMVDAFGSPESGPIGLVDGEDVVLHRRPETRTPIDAPALAVPVDIVTAYAGADSRALHSAQEAALGVVVAGLGRGNLPPAMLDGIEALIAAEKPVVVVSRTLRGRVGTQYGYEGSARRLAERGAILAPGLRAPQARIDLMLALGAGIAPVSVFGADPADTPDRRADFTTTSA